MTIQEKFKVANNIYKITTDIDLNGGSLSIPSDCTLDFQGGSIKNGKLNLNNTVLKGDKGLYHSVSLSGSCPYIESNIYIWSDNGEQNMKCLESLLSTNCDNIIFNSISPINLDVYKDFSPINITNSINFNNTTFKVSNRISDTYLFSIDNTNLVQPVSIGKELLDGKNTDFSTVTDGTGLILVKDKNTWTYRYKTEAQERRDVIFIVNGKAENSVIATYNNDYSSPDSYFVSLSNKPIVIENVSILRENSTHLTDFIDVKYASNIHINNVNVYTKIDDYAPKEGDHVFNCYYSAYISLKNINIENTYSGTKYGYAFTFDTCYNLSFSDIIANGEWGVFGCNKLNKVIIDNCDLNRFDIHCYGKDVTVKNCNITRLYNQYSSMYGYIKYENCNFYDSYMCLYDSSYNAYTNHKVIANNCSIYRSSASTMSLLIMGDFLTNPNERYELSDKYLPAVELNNVDIYTEGNISLYSFSLANDYTTQGKCYLSGNISLNKVKVHKSGESDSEFRILDTIMYIQGEAVVNLNDCNFTFYKNESDIALESEQYSRKNVTILNLKSDNGVVLNIVGGIFNYNTRTLVDNLNINVYNSALLGLRRMSSVDFQVNVYNSRVYLTNIDDGNIVSFESNMNFFDSEFITFSESQKINFINARRNAAYFLRCKSNKKQSFLLSVNDGLSIDTTTSAGLEMLEKELENKIIIPSRNIVKENALYFFKPLLPSQVKYYVWHNYTYDKQEIWDGKSWSGLLVAKGGIFDEKPKNVDVGYPYFCTDKQTEEGATDGIMIYHKGNNIWVDALGRIVT